MGPLEIGIVVIVVVGIVYYVVSGKNKVVSDTSIKSSPAPAPVRIDKNSLLEMS